MPKVIHIDNPAFVMVFAILGFVLFFILVDTICCMSGNKKKFVPYYLEQTDSKKDLNNKVEESKLKK